MPRRGDAHSIDHLVSHLLERPLWVENGQCERLLPAKSSRPTHKKRTMMHLLIRQG